MERDIKCSRSFYKSPNSIAKFKAVWMPQLLVPYDYELLGMTRPLKSKLASKEMG